MLTHCSTPGNSDTSSGAFPFVTQVLIVDALMQLGIIGRIAKTDWISCSCNVFTRGKTIVNILKYYKSVIPTITFTVLPETSFVVEPFVGSFRFPVNLLVSEMEGTAAVPFLHRSLLGAWCDQTCHHCQVQVPSPCTGFPKDAESWE